MKISQIFFILGVVGTAAANERDDMLRGSTASSKHEASSGRKLVLQVGIPDLGCFQASEVQNLVPMGLFTAAECDQLCIDKGYRYSARQVGSRIGWKCERFDTLSHGCDSFN